MGEMKRHTVSWLLRTPEDQTARHFFRVDKENLSRNHVLVGSNDTMSDHYTILTFKQYTGIILSQKSIVQWIQ